MRAVRYETFGGEPALVEVPDPECPPRGAADRGPCRHVPQRLARLAGP